MIRILPFTLAILTALVPSISRADLTRCVCDGPKSGNVKASSDDNCCIGFTTKDSKGTTQTTQFESPMSGNLLASKDGRTVIMVQSYLFGGVEDGWVVGFDDKAEKSVRNPVAILVFRDGKLIAAHRIHDLLGRPANVFQSVSHVMWLGEGRNAVELGSTVLRLSLLDGSSVSIDLLTGAATKASPAPAR